MNERRFLDELETEVRISSLAELVRPSMLTLEQAIPHLTNMFKQLSNDEKITPQFKKLLLKFIDDDCYELNCIKNLTIEFKKLDETGMNERDSIRFLQEIHRVVDCMLELSDLMGILRIHTRLLEEIIHANKTIK